MEGVLRHPTVLHQTAHLLVRLVVHAFGERPQVALGARAVHTTRAMLANACMHHVTKGRGGSGRAELGGACVLRAALAELAVELAAQLRLLAHQVAHHLVHLVRLSTGRRRRGMRLASRPWQSAHANQSVHM